MTVESTPLSRLTARNEWQGGNVGGIQWPNLPPRSMLRAWEQKMNPDVFALNGIARRVDRGTYRRRLANRLATVAGVVMWCAVVVWIVWGMTT